MELSNINTVRGLLSSAGFSFKKSLGQNFLINGDVCPAMAEAACDENTGVLEIGPGIGVLTAELAKRAKRVAAVELDERLKKILPVTLEGLNNVEIIYGDILKLDINTLLKEHFSDCSSIAVCANLPYYITSPIVMTLLENRLPIDSITVMVQKEAAERLCAEVGTRAAGAVTVAVDYFSQAEVLFGVDRESFMPPPNVDSAVIQLKIRKEPPINVSDEKEFFRFIKSAFAQRRKTLVNTLSNTSDYGKDIIKSALKESGISETVRSEQLNMTELALIFNKLYAKKAGNML